jgi:hypothetical protein
MAQGIAAGIGSGAGDDDPRGADILSEVELVSFTAKPNQIVPFGASRLSWEVKGPAGFGVRLNSVSVPKKGNRIVQPQSTTRYRLDAVALGATRSLRTITVNVDVARCEQESLFRPDVTIKGLLTSQVQNQAGIYFNSDPQVIFTPGTIRFRLNLGQSINNFPDPEIKIDASLGLTVQGGHIVAVAREIDVDVSVPFYAWAIPGAVPGLAIALSMGADRARKNTARLIEGIGQLIDFVSPFANQNLVKHSVRVGVDNDGQGTIDVQACPNDLLVKLTDLSAVAVAK